MFVLGFNKRQKAKCRTLKTNNSVQKKYKQYKRIQKEKNPGACQIFRYRPDPPSGPPSLLYYGYKVSFSGVKRPGRRVKHPPPSSAEVQEKVQLYLCYPSGTPLQVIGSTLLIMRALSNLREKTKLTVDGEPGQHTGTGTTLRTGRSGVRIPERGVLFFFYSKRPNRLWIPPSLLYNWYRVSFSGESVNNLRPTTAEVKEKVELYLSLSLSLGLRGLLQDELYIYRFCAI
jgi:hypothetical protein